MAFNSKPLYWFNSHRPELKTAVTSTSGRSHWYQQRIQIKVADVKYRYNINDPRNYKWSELPFSHDYRK